MIVSRGTPVYITIPDSDIGASSHFRALISCDVLWARGAEGCIYMYCTVVFAADITNYIMCS